MSDFATSRRERGACPSCEMLNINGLPCHETGCPEAWTTEARECKWCGQTFQPEERGQTCCEQSCWNSYNGYDDEEAEGPIEDPDAEDLIGQSPQWSTESTEDVIGQIGRVLAEEDPIAMVDKFNARYPTHGVNNGLWWRMNSWREKMPQGYAAAPCSDCGHPVAKPVTLTESVACEFCEPPEIL